MVVIPAIEVQGGSWVRTGNGDQAKPRLMPESPIEVAWRLAQAGVQHVHLIDLDAERGSGDNRKVLADIVRRTALKVLVAGGVRSTQALSAFAKAGAYGVVIDSTASRDAQLLELCSLHRPGQVLATLDVRGSRRDIATKPVAEPVMVGDLLKRWDGLPLGGVILSCVDREETLAGPDLEAIAMVRRMTGHPVHYWGGVSSREDIKRVAAAGAYAVILHRAIHDGALTLEQALSR